MEGKEFITYLKAQRKLKYSYNVESIKIVSNAFKEGHEGYMLSYSIAAAKTFFFSVINCKATGLRKFCFHHKITLHFAFNTK